MGRILRAYNGLLLLLLVEDVLWSTEDCLQSAGVLGRSFQVRTEKSRTLWNLPVVSEQNVCLCGTTTAVPRFWPLFLHLLQLLDHFQRSVNNIIFIKM
ncbi:hypothetical protein C0J52_28271 [Blattella germanica]|nr:hypothetical protein C0J52_28271 [Blattella germanica]